MHVEVQKLKKGYLQGRSSVGSNALIVGSERREETAISDNAVKHRVTTVDLSHIELWVYDCYCVSRAATCIFRSL